MSALLPFLPIASVLLLAAWTMGGIAVRVRYERSPGLAALLFPFSILFVSALCEALRVLAAIVGSVTPFLEDVSASVRMFNGLGWLLLCHSHLALHGKLGRRRLLTAPVAALTVGFVAWYLAGAAMGERDVPRAAGLDFMSATGLYAALSGVFSLGARVRLWPSARAGLRMAVFALVFYPTALVIERLGIPLPFIDPGRTAFEQVFPFFLFVFVVVALPAVFTREKGALAEPGDARAAESLTDREREVAILLRDGRSLKEIAVELSLSVPTIKSHAGSAYRKLGVSGKKELAHVSLD